MNEKLTAGPAWQDLKAHFRRVRKLHLRELFAADPGRTERFTLKSGDLSVDFSKNRITEETLKLLMQLARASGLAEEIERMFRGERINRTEDRPVLHTALRNLSDEPVLVDGHDVMPRIGAVLEQMKRISRRIRAGEWKGYTGKPLRDVVHIGIGGSGLGPQMAVEALRHYNSVGLRFHFVANVDPDALSGVLREVDPERVLFIVASKTFTTLETAANAGAARRWLLGRFRESRCLSYHFLAVTAAPEKAQEFGLEPENVLEMWEWIGGRFSLCSAVGLPVMLAAGEDRFVEMLRGFHDMDHHFRTVPLEGNIPVIMALIGIWNIDFLGAPTLAILPYSHALRFLPAYLQQLDMESNGKSVNRRGRRVTYATAPVIWGGSGTEGQHAFFQLLHQGTHLVPCDFIGFSQPLSGMEEQHRHLLANFYAQSEAMAFGKSRRELREEKIPSCLIPFKVFAGNRPSTSILAPKLTPYVLGQLVALYEHKVFSQGVIWNINSFDQWGVELGKVLAKKIAAQLAQGDD